MNYPLISEYIEAIKNAEDNFNELSHLRPVLNEDGSPVMSSGNFAVVFKMTDGQKDYAIKCFTHEQDDILLQYKEIDKELSSPFVLKTKTVHNYIFLLGSIFFVK